MSPQGPAKAQGLERLQTALDQNLCQWQRHAVASCLDETYWFSNEFEAGPLQEQLRLVDSFAQIPQKKALHSYHIAILTGEGGLFQGLPELAAQCDLTLQLDCNPLPLQFCRYLLEESYKADAHTDKELVLNKAISRFQASNPHITATQIKELRTQFSDYTIGMRNNLFASPERFAAFQQCRNHPVQQICLDYFAKENMAALAATLKQHDAVVHFFNITNVCEYPMYFYQTNPYQDEVQDINPCLYMRQLPFSDNGLCAYSQLFGIKFFTSTCTIANMEQDLHATALNRRDRMLKKLAAAQWESTDIFVEHDESSEPGENNPPELLPTRVFLFCAHHPGLRDNNWILRLTASRLTLKEHRNLQIHSHKILAIYTQNTSPRPNGTRYPAPFLPQLLHKATEVSTEA